MLDLKESRPDNVFVINDVTLAVPPTAIQINQEDLLYNWKTLRTKVSTKIATGSGQIRVNVSIVFTNDMLLQMHRLIVEFQHSPFCSVHNAFLRESIVPGWPAHQQMAFTLTSMHLNPVPDASDVWSMELGFLWFNYFPYTHNFLYRRDWTTNWLGGQDEREQVKLSIGWALDEAHERVPRLSIVDRRGPEGADLRPRWSLNKNEKLAVNHNMLRDMEAMHFGDSFDMLPLPSNMESSEFVTRASSSLIYVRYINYLQRDHLQRHFGFDVEEDLGQGAAAYFATVLNDKGELTTLPLTAAPTYLTSEWASRMLEHNSGVDFSFHEFKVIKAPGEHLEALQNAYREALPAAPPSRKSNAYAAFTPRVLRDTGKVGTTYNVGKYVVRNGYWYPEGLYTPIGESVTASEPASIQYTLNRVSSIVQWRDASFFKRVYAKDAAGSQVKGRAHKGTDFAVGVGTPVFSVADGTVTTCRLGERGEGLRWRFYNPSTGARGNVTGSSYQSDWEQTVTARGYATKRDGWFGVQLADASKQKVGTVFPSLTKGVWYVSEYTDGGQQVTVLHDDGSESKYLHLDTITVQRGQRVRGGQKIATVGRTSTFSNQFITSHLSKASAAAPPTRIFSESLSVQDTNTWTLGAHLHFEYHEVEANSVGSGLKRVLVNPVPGWKAASDKTLNRFPGGEEVAGPLPVADLPRATEDETIQAIAEEANPEIRFATSPLEKAVMSLNQIEYELNKLGWFRYEGDTRIQDLWQRVTRVTVNNQNNAGPGFENQGAVLMGVTGGLRHIVANIPILSHEYPTQQHLGSIEPTFTLDFAIRDASASLDGLSPQGRQLQNMRSLLQQNGRGFKLVPDAWCVSTDTFVTRLFGTRHQRDFSTEIVPLRGIENEVQLSKPNLTKRSSIMRSSANTAPGNPGVSYVSFEVQETNPFSYEKIQSASVGGPTEDEKRRAVLEKLYTLDFLEEENITALLVSLGEKLKKDFLNVGHEDFGRLVLNYYNRENAPGGSAAMLIDSREDAFVWDDGTTRKLLVKAPEFNKNPMQDREQPVMGFNASMNLAESAQFPGYLEYVDENLLTSDEFRNTLPEGPAGRDRPPRPVPRTITLDLTKQLLDRDDLAGAEVINGGMSKVVEYRRALQDLMTLAGRSLTEHESLLVSGKYERHNRAVNPGGFSGLPLERVQSQLFGVPVEPQMWRSWQDFLLKASAAEFGWTRANQITTASNWLTWKEQISLSAQQINQNYLARGSTSPMGYLRAYMPGARDFSGALAAVQRNPMLSTSWQKSAVREDRLKLAMRYVGSFDAAIEFRSVAERFGYNTFLRGILGESSEDTPKAFENMLSTFADSALNVNYDSKEQRLDVLPGVNLLDYAPAGIDEKVYQRFEWQVSDAVEEAKLAYFRKSFARIADEILQNEPDVLQMMGLLEMSHSSQVAAPNHSEAYPDLDLPWHPFFYDTKSTPPDFYFWNIYDDGGAFGEEVRTLMQNNLEEVVQNSYNSYKRLEKGEELDPKEYLDPELVDIDQMEDMLIPVKYSAEGTDTGTFGPMTAYFAQTEQDAEGERDFKNKLSSQMQSFAKEAASIAGGTKMASMAIDLGTSLFGNIGEESKPVFEMSSVTGTAALQYPLAMSPEKRQELMREVKNIQQMFGNRQGYLDANTPRSELPMDIKRSTSLLEHPDEFSHRFDPASLQKLALDSSKDIVSQRMRMSGAYPTFKLFFIEEDELENRLLSFDDFFSYNAVHSFTCERSSTNPADHLVITLQNVSGTLDGTKRASITDLDYFNGELEKKTGPRGSGGLSDQAVEWNDDREQPFDSLVLRPGMNVQLRCGYSNNPDDLAVLISGRVVDIQWNKNGDLAELLVQSFGTELIQQIKGTIRDGTGQTYHTTHELLGSLMLSSELQHFGRWELGQMYQHGESKDHTFDLYDYGKQNKSYRLDTISSAQDYFNSGWGLSKLFHVDTMKFAYAMHSDAHGAWHSGLQKTLGADVLHRFIKDTRFNATAFFKAGVASLKLSPQDDNLYPPHPKDYMIVDEPGMSTWARAIHDAIADNNFQLEKGGTIWNIASAPTRFLNSSIQTGNYYGARWLAPYAFPDEDSYSKKSVPKDFQYQLISQTIWQTFHEMSLRHPGWVYGARPYGTDFRYTMFFGVPSQRYWARGASNNFTHRMNKLHELIEKAPYLDARAMEFEFRRIYGSDPRFAMRYDDMQAQALLNSNVNPVHPNDEIESNFHSVPYFEHMTNNIMGQVLREYLNGLNFRFKPFRKYHLVSSERNLVWNGIINAEGAVVNAVDVTYFNELVNAERHSVTPVASTLIKAHSNIPEHMLKIAPVRWQNCRSYNMAMRYGMGELLHRMRAMYRGEVIVRGNARIEPWDICILTDTYNDMMGPFEVEQVVHNFSHETGFITEIKPAAVLFGNEIASWPILEGLKTWALAVKDIEDNYKELSGDPNPSHQSGLIGTAANQINKWTAEDHAKVLRARNKSLFDDIESGDGLAELVFDDSNPNNPVYDEIVKANSSFKEIWEGPAYQMMAKGRSVTGREQLSPSWAWLMGGPLLFLRCLRQDTVICLPLVKNGKPIVSGLTMSDPTVLWRSFRGDLRLVIEETMEGTFDMFEEYARVGTAMWNRFQWTNPMTQSGLNYVSNLDLTGGEQ